MKDKKCKKITMKLFLGMVVMVLVFGKGSVDVTAADDNFNWVQWYEWNGMGSVVGEIMSGNRTPLDACETILRPAIEAGCVTSTQVDYFLRRYPEMEAWFISAGVPPTNPTINIPTNPAPEPTPTTPQYTIEDCDMESYATTDVNVRVEPSTNTNKVGNVPQNEKVHVTGKTSNGWYRLEYNGTTGFSVSKYFADKPIEKVEDVTDVPEPTPVPTPEPTPVPTEEPTVEPTATPEPTEEPNDTKTEIVEPIETEKPVETPVPTVIPTEAPVVDEPTAEATAEPVMDVIEPTPAPVVDTPVVTEPVEENNFMPWIVLGGVVVVLGVVAVIALRRKK